VFAARALGASTPRLLFRHILPNTVAPITVLSSFELANLMLTEASLSFLGLGVQPPTPSWGNMIAQGREYLYTAWWLTAMPGLAPAGPAAVPPADAAPASVAASAPAAGLSGGALASPTAPETIKVAASASVSATGFFIGLERGYFREQGIDVEIVPFEGAK